MNEKPKRTIALAGNPNVGKSTLFNALTGSKQKTGNWTGKTVSTAKGICDGESYSFELVDLPGTYSLVAHSYEEEVARDYIASGEHDGVVVVCDAGCLERNLNLVLQILEITHKVLVCVNLMDEAEKRGISVDLKRLSQLLGVPVVGTVAKDGKSIDKFKTALDEFMDSNISVPYRVVYPVKVELAVSAIELELGISRWLSLKYLLGEIAPKSEKARQVVEREGKKWNEVELNGEKLQDVVVKTIVSAAESISKQTVTGGDKSYSKRDRRIDKILTGRITGYPVMIALFALIFWLTMAGANYPSQLLSNALFTVQDWLTALFQKLNAPDWLHGILVLGVFRVTAWVVAVMLPPMAIFFPLFTILEDLGYLPRIAYILDKPFKSCRACGKQALTMW